MGRTGWHVSVVLMAVMMCFWPRGAVSELVDALDGEEVVWSALDGQRLAARFPGNASGDDGNYRRVLELVGYRSPPRYSPCGIRARYRLQKMWDEGQLRLIEAEGGPSPGHTHAAPATEEFTEYVQDANGLGRKLIRMGLALPEEGQERTFREDVQYARALKVGCVHDDDAEASPGSIPKLVPTERRSVGDGARSGRVSLPTAGRKVRTTGWPTGFRREAVMHGPEFMTDFRFLPDGGMLVLQKTGLLLSVSAGADTVSRRPFADFSAICNDFFDRGAQRFVLHPNFRTNRQLFVFFTYEDDPRPVAYERPKASRVMRMTAERHLRYEAPRSRLTILGRKVGRCPVWGSSDCLPASARGHTGGGMAFDSDGWLYVAVGDNALSDVTAASVRAQQLGHFIGKVLRVDPATGEGAPGNPFLSAGMRRTSRNAKIYARGLRSPYSLEPSHRPGAVFLADVMWATEEEVSLVTAGANLGWPCREGTTARPEFSVYPECGVKFDPDEATDPLVSWQRDRFSTGAGVVGEYLDIPRWPWRYRRVQAFGDMAGEWMGFLRTSSDPERAQPVPERFRLEGNPVAFRVGPDRRLYVLEIRQRRIIAVDYVRDHSPIAISEMDPPRGGAISSGTPGARVFLRFNKSLIPESVTDKNVYLVGRNRRLIRSSVSFSFARRVAVLTVREALEPDRRYTVVVAGVRDLHLNRPRHTIRLALQARRSVDNRRPVVRSIRPRAHARDVAPTARLTVTFNEGMDRSSFTPDTVILRGKVLLNGRWITEALHVPIVIGYSSTQRALRIRPGRALDPGREYTVAISGRVRDLAGNSLGRTFSAPFRTAEARQRTLVPGVAGEISLPKPNTSVRVGSRVSFAGRLVDVDGSALDPENHRFALKVFHCSSSDARNCHEHVIQRWEGVVAGTFVAPQHTDRFYYRLQMEASNGITSKAFYRDIQAVQSRVTFESRPAGAPVYVNGVRRITPFALSMAQDSINSLYVDREVVVGGMTRQFQRWRSGGTGRRRPRYIAPRRDATEVVVYN